jgi:hypothetical protein
MKNERIQCQLVFIIKMAKNKCYVTTARVWLLHQISLMLLKKAKTRADLLTHFSSFKE